MTSRDNRGIVGMLLICLIAGSVMTQFLVLGRQSPPIQILDNAFPKAIPSGDRPQEFNFGFITGKDLAEIELRFSMLMKMPIPPPLNKALTTNIPLDDLASLIPTVASLRSLLQRIETPSNLAAIAEVVDEKVELPGGSRGRAVLYDFGQAYDLLRPVVDSRIPSAYLVIIADNGTVVSYGEGVSDFFFAKWTSIKALGISRGNQKQEYFAEYFGELGLPTVSAAPAGRIVYESVPADTKINVYFSVLASSVPRHEGMYQIIRTYGDRQVLDVTLNWMSPS